MATRLTTILVLVIVGATFIAGLIVGAQRDDASGPVDLIIVNGKVYSGDRAELQEAVAVRGNQILRVGSNREVKRLRRAQTVVVDAHGATVLPGLNDSHVQLMAGALAFEDLNLADAATVQDIETELRVYAESEPNRPWLIGRNAAAELLDAANAPARKLLDKAVHDRPAMITDESGNVAWVNSKGLEMAGIGRRTRSPHAGTVVRERRNSEPTGVLKGAAVELVTQQLPQHTHAEKIAALRTAIAEAHKLGVTSMQTVSPTEEELRLLNEIRQQGDLSVRVYGSIAVAPTITEAAVRELDKLREQYPDDPALKVGGVEIICPCEPTQLNSAVTLLEKHDWPIMVRTSDGADVQAAVAAFDLVDDSAPQRSSARRYRLDDNLLTDGNIRILFGSNWPAKALDPLEAIEEMVAGPGELRNAIDAYTNHAAFASEDEQRKGTLAPGMLADIVILSKDIFEDETEPLQDADVTVTIFDGKIVYQRPAAATSND